MTRYETTIAENRVYVETATTIIEVGDIDTIIEVIGGPSWTISYSDHDKRAYPHIDTSDEGLTIDVVDAINAMTFDESFVETLAAQPTTAPSPEAISPRLGLFIGRLLENLEYGIR